MAAQIEEEEEEEEVKDGWEGKLIVTWIIQFSALIDDQKKFKIDKCRKCNTFFKYKLASLLVR